LVILPLLRFSSWTCLMRSKPTVLVAALAAILCCGVSLAQTPVSALDFDHNIEWVDSPGYSPASSHGFALDGYWSTGLGGIRSTQGWVFDVLEPVVVTHLGMYDTSKDGLESTVVVGIWGDSDTPIEIGTVAANAPLMGNWRTAQLQSELTLQPGRYTIGAVYTSATPAEVANIGSLLPQYIGGSVEQFLWNLDITSGGNLGLAMPDERLSLNQSWPTFSVFGQDDNIAGYAVLKKPSDGYLISGAMVGPTFFVVPQIPEPMSCVLAGVAAMLFVTGWRRAQ
jgi:hypothetical protein